jgi:hypothetical protein
MCKPAHAEHPVRMPDPDLNLIILAASLSGTFTPSVAKHSGVNGF